MISGILVVDKEEGPTSRRVVDLTRRALGEKKAGHLGTLDPFATGVLPICLGKATRLARFLSGGGKTYEGVIRLGATSDTLDRTGTILSERELPAGLDRETLDPHLDRLRGEIDQIPPMYSAVQVNGQRLYRLARQGIEVERKPRQVTIHRFDLTSLALPLVSFQVRCSPGTYIRSLVHDLGEALGCGALLDELRRTSAEPFSLIQAVPQGELEDQGRREELLTRVIPLEALELGLPRLTLPPEAAALVEHGGAVPLPGDFSLPPESPDEEQHICLHRPDGSLAAVARLGPSPRALIQPVVVLARDVE
jgi:tRNA pseudouridine55 synthase